jgi:hypothetical protein
MKRFLTVILVALCAVLFFGGTATAQRGDSACTFFSACGPALLFEVQDLSLASYEGGVGLGWVCSPRLLARVSLNVRTDSRREEDSDYQPSTTVTNSHTIGVQVSPWFMLYRTTPVFTFCGPVIGGTRGYWKSTTERIDSAYTAVSWSEHKDWTLNFGALLGLGVEAMERIVLTAEYRYLVAYQRRTGSNGLKPSTYDAVSSSESSSWTTASTVQLTIAWKF